MNHDLRIGLAEAIGTAVLLIGGAVGMLTTRKLAPELPNDA